MSLDPNATVRRRDLRTPPPRPAEPPVRPRRLAAARGRAAGAWSLWQEAVGKARRRLIVASRPWRDAAAPLVERAGLILGSVTPLGWAVLAMATLGWLLALTLGWAELAIGAAVLSVLFVLCCVFTIGRMQLSVDLEVDPRRVVVGGSAAGRIQVTNVARTPLLPLGLECPVGRSVARYTLPPLAGGASQEEIMVIPTAKRGVIELGPVTTMRGDPFGVVRREITWTDRIDLFVHPRTVPLEPVGTGLLRDLEGHTTNDTSMSDLAFHTLREYVPGDDRRYIHWRSSAKASAAAGAGTFLVRQFLDTRRSHIAIVTDAQASSYAGESEFELAVSVAASVALRALADEMDLTIVCGEHAASDPPPHIALDTYSRATWNAQWPLPAATGRLSQLAPDASVAVLVTGSTSDFATLQQARAYLPNEVNAFAIIVDQAGSMSLRQAGGLTILTLAELSDLPVVLRGGQIQ